MNKYDKTFIIDTNVILHDPSSIQILSNENKNLICLPIVVLEELDHFKSGSSPINFNARQFIRMLEKENIDIDIDIKNYSFPDSIPLFTNNIDNKILAYAYHKTNSVKNKKKIIFLTKDINLRMKAKALKLNAEDFNIDKKGFTEYTGFSEIEIDSKTIEDLHKSGITTNKIKVDLISNQYILFKDSGNSKHTALAKVDKVNNKISPLVSTTCAGISPKNMEQQFAMDALLNNKMPLVVLTGISGSGKTLLSLAAAIYNKRYYHQIYITRQAVPVGNELGFLPGSAEEKIRPYLEPFFDNLKYLKTLNGNREKIDKLFEQEKISIAPITYSRGRSMPKAFIIIDECQNMTPHELKTMITRAGEGTKVVLLGDLSQIDTPYLDKNTNGLTYTINKFKGQKLFSYIHLSKGERSELADLASKIM